MSLSSQKGEARGWPHVTISVSVLFRHNEGSCGTPFAFPFLEGRGKGESMAGLDRRPFPLPASPFGKGWRDGGLVDGRLGSQNGTIGLGVCPSPFATRRPLVEKGCVCCFRQREATSEGKEWGHVVLPLPFGFAWGLAWNLSGASLVLLRTIKGPPRVQPRKHLQRGLVQQTCP